MNARQLSDCNVARLETELRQLGEVVQLRIYVAERSFYNDGEAGKPAPHEAYTTDDAAHALNARVKSVVTESLPLLPSRYWEVYAELMEVGAAESIPNWAHELHDQRQLPKEADYPSRKDWFIALLVHNCEG